MELGEELVKSQRVVGANLPILLESIGVLFVGWLMALVVSILVGAAAGKLKAEQQFTNLVREKENIRGVSFDLYVKKITFLILMLFVLIVFFLILGLLSTYEPASAFLTTLASQTPFFPKELRYAY